MNLCCKPKPVNMTHEQKEAVNQLLQRVSPYTTCDRFQLGLSEIGLALVPVADADPGWISVEERLPEAGLHVLTYRASSDEFDVAYECDGSFFSTLTGDITDHPTHWRPLPPLPEPKREEAAPAPVADTQRCPMCNGSGLWEQEYQCRHCHGTGTVSRRDQQR